MHFNTTQTKRYSFLGNQQGRRNNRDMNVEEFREYCLSLPDVTEATPFEKFSKGKFTILVF